MTKPFTDVEFLREYPSNRVAEHEIFMSFVNDDDATAFWEWWLSNGSTHFAKYLAKKERENASHRG